MFINETRLKRENRFSSPVDLTIPEVVLPTQNPSLQESFEAIEQPLITPELPTPDPLQFATYPSLYSGSSSELDYLDSLLDNTYSIKTQEEIQQEREQLSRQMLQYLQQDNQRTPVDSMVGEAPPDYLDDGDFSNDFQPFKGRFGEFGEGPLGALGYVAQNILGFTPAVADVADANWAAVGGFLDTVGDAAQGIVNTVQGRPPSLSWNWLPPVAIFNNAMERWRQARPSGHPYIVQQALGRDVSWSGPTLTGNIQNDYTAKFGDNTVAQFLDNLLGVGDITDTYSNITANSFAKIFNDIAANIPGIGNEALRENSARLNAEITEQFNALPPELRGRFQARQAVGLLADMFLDPAEVVSAFMPMARGLRGAGNSPIPPAEVIDQTRTLLNDTTVEYLRDLNYSDFQPPSPTPPDPYRQMVIDAYQNQIANLSPDAVYNEWETTLAQLYAESKPVTTREPGAYLAQLSDIDLDLDTLSTTAPFRFPPEASTSIAPIEAAPAVPDRPYVIPKETTRVVIPDITKSELPSLYQQVSGMGWFPKITIADNVLLADNLPYVRATPENTTAIEMGRLMGDLHANGITLGSVSLDNFIQTPQGLKIRNLGSARTNASPRSIAWEKKKVEDFIRTNFKEEYLWRDASGVDSAMTQDYANALYRFRAGYSRTVLPSEADMARYGETGTISVTVDSASPYIIPEEIVGRQDPYNLGLPSPEPTGALPSNVLPPYYQGTSPSNTLRLAGSNVPGAIELAGVHIRQPTGTVEEVYKPFTHEYLISNSLLPHGDIYVPGLNEALTEETFYTQLAKVDRGFDDYYRRPLQLPMIAQSFLVDATQAPGALVKAPTFTLPAIPSPPTPKPQPIELPMEFVEKAKMTPLLTPREDGKLGVKPGKAFHRGNPVTPQEFGKRLAYLNSQGIFLPNLRLSEIRVGKKGGQARIYFTPSRYETTNADVALLRQTDNLRQILEQEFAKDYADAVLREWNKRFKKDAPRIIQDEAIRRTAASEFEEIYQSIKNVDELDYIRANYEKVVAPLVDYFKINLSIYPDQDSLAKVLANRVKEEKDRRISAGTTSKYVAPTPQTTPRRVEGVVQERLAEARETRERSRQQIVRAKIQQGIESQDIIIQNGQRVMKAVTVDGQQILDASTVIDLSNYTQAIPIEMLPTLIDLMIANPNAVVYQGRELRLESNRASAGFTRTKNDINRIGSLLPHPTQPGRPLVPPTKEIAEAFQAKHGVPHPYAEFAIDKKRWSLKVSTSKSGKPKNNVYSAVAIGQELGGIWQKILDPTYNVEVGGKSLPGGYPTEFLDIFEERMASGQPLIAKIDEDAYVELPRPVITGPAEGMSYQDMVQYLTVINESGRIKVRPNLKNAPLETIASEYNRVVQEVERIGGLDSTPERLTPPIASVVEKAQKEIVGDLRKERGALPLEEPTRLSTLLSSRPDSIPVEEWLYLLDKKDLAFLFKELEVTPGERYSYKALASKIKKQVYKAPEIPAAPPKEVNPRIYEEALRQIRELPSQGFYEHLLELFPSEQFRREILNSLGLVSIKIGSERLNIRPYEMDIEDVDYVLMNRAGKKDLSVAELEKKEKVETPVETGPLPENLVSMKGNDLKALAKRRGIKLPQNATKAEVIALLLSEGELPNPSVLTPTKTPNQPTPTPTPEPILTPEPKPKETSKETSTASEWISVEQIKGGTTTPDTLRVPVSPDLSLEEARRFFTSYIERYGNLDSNDPVLKLMKEKIVDSVTNPLNVSSAVKYVRDVLSDNFSAKKTAQNFYGRRNVNYVEELYQRYARVRENKKVPDKKPTPTPVEEAPYGSQPYDVSYTPDEIEEVYQELTAIDKDYILDDVIKGYDNGRQLIPVAQSRNPSIKTAQQARKFFMDILESKDVQKEIVQEAEDLLGDIEIDSDTLVEVSNMVEQIEEQMANVARVAEKVQEAKSNAEYTSLTTLMSQLENKENLVETFKHIQRLIDEMSADTQRAMQDVSFSINELAATVEDILYTAKDKKTKAAGQKLQNSLIDLMMQDPNKWCI